MNSFFKGISQIFVDMGKGFKYIFVDGPKKLFGKDKNSNEKKPDTNNENVNFIEGKNQDNLRKQLNNWYDNLSFVKKKKEAYIATLKPFVLNPDGSDGIKSPEKVTYKYIAKSPEGNIVEDFFLAQSKLDVYSYLTDNKYTVYSIETNKNVEFLHGKSFGGLTKMSNKDLVFWLTQLSTYIKAGIPLTDSVKVLAQQDKRKKYKSLYQAIIYELTMGQTFSEALEKQGKAFPSLLVNMIKSSEMTGSIEETLDEMSAYYEEIEDTKSAIKSALAYPILVLAFAIGIVIFMLVYIIPKFVDVYESMDSEIPKITQITISISNFLQTQYLWLILGVVFVVTLFTFLFKKVRSFKALIQRMLMKLPIVGPLTIAKEMTIFARTFASLQKNNVLLTDSIEILSKITNNEIYRELETRTVQNLIKGNKMSDTFKNNWAIPDLALFMITTGESTGDLPEMLDKVADFYNKQQKSIISSIKAFIEPVMILGLAVIVGILLVAILVPMFGIYQTIS